jgi:hypothetical protein
MTVATVSSLGVITARAEGQATITASSSNNVTSTMTVSVRYDVGSFTFTEVEPNYSMSLADSINRNGTTIFGRMSSKSDIDVFRVYLTSGSTITFRLTTQYSVDLPYYLIGFYNAADTILGAATIVGDILEFTFTVSTTGNYYIYILYSSSSPYSDGGNYTSYVYWY